MINDIRLFYSNSLQVFFSIVLFFKPILLMRNGIIILYYNKVNNLKFPSLIINLVDLTNIFTKALHRLWSLVLLFCLVLNYK